MASQSGGITDRSSSAINSSTSTAVAAQNKGRQYLFIQNLSAIVMHVRLGAAAVAGAAGNIYLAANGGSVIWEGNEFVPTNSVNVISASGSSLVVTVLEG